MDDRGSTLAELLDQPSTTDPFHPHMGTKPSQAIIPDRDRLIAILLELARYAAGKQSLSPALADLAVGEANCDNAVYQDGVNIGAFSTQLIHVRDEKTSGTDGGTSTVKCYQAREEEQ